MGEAGQTRGLSDAPGGRPAGGLVARSALKRFARNQSGATAIEVGLLVACICIAIISAVSMLSGSIKTSFDKTSTAVASTQGS
ncbi:Flp family type IVb pilin [Caulobacter henricii]|uniref:Flp family type IVb pilin n=1 Tax=Caulobacter henricii TaxID=69395 RepID=UPI001412327F|nr:Flp family type IVb pilin [Caulobacter henricii]